MSDAYVDLWRALPVEGLVPGDPIAIDQLAQTLLRWSDLFADAARALRRIDVVWTGQAAQAFEAEFQLQPAAFGAAATAMRDAGYALGSYAIAFDSARQGAGIALETFRRGVRTGLAARAAANMAAGGLLLTPGPPDLHAESAGLEDRLTGVEKLDAAREALRAAGDRAAAILRGVMADAPQQVSALEHAANFSYGLSVPWVWNEEKADFYAGGARGVLELGVLAAMPVAGPTVMAPVNNALDDLQWRWNVGSHSGFHKTGAFVIPTVATWGVGAVAAGVEARVPQLLVGTILPKGVNAKPVFLYRGMLSAEDGYPEVGATAKSLGARPKVWIPREGGDIPIDSEGLVWPVTGGMSANTQITGIPGFRRPPAFGGTGKNLDMFNIQEHHLPTDLAFRSDVEGHGFIEPTQPMTFDEMQLLIHSTRLLWRKVDPAP